MANPSAIADKSKAEKLSEKILEKRRALGRGLDSLLPGPRVVAPATSPQPSTVSPQEKVSTGASRDGDTVDLQAASAEPPLDGERTIELPLDWIERNPHQTRLEFDPKALSDLAGSIQSQGVLQPIVVRPATIQPGRYGYTTVEGEIKRTEEVGTLLQPLAPVVPGGHPRYVLILGERRFRASKMAGKTTIPAIVKRVSEQQAAEMTLVENLQRQDLDCLEQAEAFRHLSTEFHLTQEQIGKRVGVSREQVSNYLRLLSLPPTVLESLRKKELTYSHARLLLSLQDDVQIAKVAQTVVAKKMSVALLQDMILNIDLHRERPDPQQGTARWVDPNVRAAQRSLETVLGMRVRIRDRKGKGKITIEYGTLEDFDRVVGMLKGEKG